MKATLFTNGKIVGTQDPADILVDDGKFLEIKPFLSEIYNDVKKVDLEGKLVLPPYVEPHIHLDYVYTARTPGVKNITDTLFEGIQRWSEIKNNRTIEEDKERARIAIKKEILTGIQFIRTHVDVTDTSLTSLKALMELKEEFKDLVTMQIVAFPQEGVYSYKDGDKLLEEALKMGADVVGAIPHFEFTRELGEKSLNKIFELAVKYNKLVDVHCDETDDEHSRFIETLATLSYFNDYGNYTTASHTCAMGSYNNAYASKLIRLLKLSNINFVVCPTENIHLQGRGDNYPKRRGVTRVKELIDAGLNVCFAQDSISDLWYPLGSGNLMNILDAGLHICHMTSIDQVYNAFDLITVNGAKTLNIQSQYGIEKGKPANFIVLNATDEFDAICDRVPVACSVRKGEVIFQRAPEVIITDNILLK